MVSKKPMRKLLVTAGLCGLLLCGCGSKEKEKPLNYMYQHMVPDAYSGVDVTPPVRTPDADGFFDTEDSLYVISDTLNIRKQASVESALLQTVTYGTKLNRTGEGTNGWDRIEFEGETAYVSQKYTISVPIGELQDFTFSAALLTMVDTSRQMYGYEAMCADLRELKEAYGSHMQLNVLGVTKDNRNIYEVVLGNPEAEHQILLAGSICGTEYMSTLICMKQMEYYLCFYDSGSYRGIRYSDLFEHVAIRVIPMLNPDGVTISQEFAGGIQNASIREQLKQWYEAERSNGGTSLNQDNFYMFFEANANGTDLRRNFPFVFEQAAGTASQGSKGYAGAFAGSEPETKALQWALLQKQTDLFVLYRTSGVLVEGGVAAETKLAGKISEYGKAMAEFMSYEYAEDKDNAKQYGSPCGYAANELQIPAISVRLGAGSAPLALNEFSSIWNAARESWAAMQMKVLALEKN